MNMTALIVDDEITARNTLKKFLSVYCTEVLVMAECSSVKEGFEYLMTNAEPDMVFLDVHLSDGDGFDLLQKLPKVNFEIIFTTGYNNYAIKAIKHAALDYLVKPIVAEELKEAVSRVIKKKAETSNVQSSVAYRFSPSPMNGRIAVADNDGVRIIPINKIIYCKAEGNYTLFVLSSNEKLMICKNLKEYERQLPHPNFLRIHNSYLINLEHVKLYARGRGGHVEMISGECLDVARNRKQLLLDILLPRN
jgi:two-component system LytT family response regulator